jgi:hypothetical protein
MVGVLFTFLMFRFFPVPKQTGYDGMDALSYVFMSLGAVLILFITGLIMDKKHPYSLFAICLSVFVTLLVLIRILGV